MLAQSLSRLSQAAPSTSKKTKTKTKAIATTVPVSKVEAPAEIDPKLLSLFADVDKKAESRYSTLKVESKQPSAKDIARERELAKKPAKRPRYGEEGYLDHADELGAADAKRAKRQKTAHRSNDRHGGKYNIDDDEEIESILAQDGGDNDFDVDDDDDDDDADDHEDNDEGDDDDDDGEGDDDADADAATSDTEPADGDGEAVDATTAAAGADGPSRRRSAKEEATRNRRTIFVSNLPIGTTEKELKKHFKQYGKIESTRIRSVPVGKQTISKKVGSPACCHACCVCAMQPATHSLALSALSTGELLYAELPSTARLVQRLRGVRRQGRCHQRVCRERQALQWPPSARRYRCQLGQDAGHSSRTCHLAMCRIDSAIVCSSTVVRVDRVCRQRCLPCKGRRPLGAL